MARFKALIEIIGVNPYVLLPQKVLAAVCRQAGRDKGPIPVKGTIDGHEYTQTLVKYSGHWRLYLNTPMRKAAGKDVGDTASFTIVYDPADRTVPMHPKLAVALERSKQARLIYDGLPPSRQKEINRYINAIKSEDTQNRNVEKALAFLVGKARFIGRDHPR